MNVKTGIREGGQPVRIVHCHGCKHAVLQQHRLECPCCGRVNSPDQVVIDDEVIPNGVCVKCSKEPVGWTMAACDEYDRRMS